MQTEQICGKPFVSTGFREAVLSVSDLQGYIDFFSELGGWQLCAEGTTDRKLLRLWGLGDKVGAKEVLMRAPGSRTGFVRLVQFQGAQQQQIRSNDQSWDTGGIFDINARVKDLERTAAAMQAQNWQGVVAPNVFQFGPFTVKEWLARGPDGIRFALIERIDPPLEEQLPPHGFSQVFNSTQIVKDLERTRDFYAGTLGFKTYLESTQVNEKPGPSVLGLPHNLSTSIKYQAAMLSPSGKNAGSVEILRLDGATGTDFSALGIPPNLGMLMLRFPVSDAAGFAKELEGRGVAIAAGPGQAELPGYGACMLFALRAPEGAWLEFFTEG